MCERCIQTLKEHRTMTGTIHYWKRDRVMPTATTGIAPGGANRLIVNKWHGDFECVEQLSDFIRQIPDDKYMYYIRGLCVVWNGEHPKLLSMYIEKSDYGQRRPSSYQFLNMPDEPEIELAITMLFMETGHAKWVKSINSQHHDEPIPMSLMTTELELDEGVTT